MTTAELLAELEALEPRLDAVADKLLELEEAGELEGDAGAWVRTATRRMGDTRRRLEDVAELVDPPTPDLDELEGEGRR